MEHLISPPGEQQIPHRLAPVRNDKRVGGVWLGGLTDRADTKIEPKGKPRLAARLGAIRGLKAAKMRML
jgi:hypothetical protein